MNYRDLREDALMALGRYGQGVAVGILLLAVAVAFASLAGEAFTKTAIAQERHAQVDK
jgi:hypothetical protein